MPPLSCSNFGVSPVGFEFMIFSGEDSCQKCIFLSNLITSMYFAYFMPMDKNSIYIYLYFWNLCFCATHRAVEFNENSAVIQAFVTGKSDPR